MEQDNGFEFELNEDEKSWSITNYNGKSEEVIFPASFKDMPVKTIELKEISGKAGNFNEGIKRVVIPEGIASFGRDAFGYCSGLTNIRLPVNLIDIEDWIFDGCIRLTEIIVDENNPVFCSQEGVLFDKAMATLLCFPMGKKGKYSVPDGVIRTSYFAFDDCERLTGIYFPQSVLSISDYRFNNDQLRDIMVNESNPRYCSIDGVLFDKKKSELLRYPPNKNKTEYAVPDGIIDIGNMAFFRCKRLISIALPESLEFISNSAFAECEGLKEISLPANLLYVGELAFTGCSNLETVTLSRKTKIGNWAFEWFKGKFVYRD